MKEAVEIGKTIRSERLPNRILRIARLLVWEWGSCPETRVRVRPRRAGRRPFHSRDS